MTLRVAIIAILALLLLIPLNMVEGLIREREWRKQSAQQEVSESWGGEQTLTGPVISVPYETVMRVDAGDGSGRSELKTVTQYARFLPESLDIGVELLPEKRHRGIYDVVVYRARIALTGHFKGLAANDLGVNDKLRWAHAQVAVGVSDLRSIREQVHMRIGARDLAFEPGPASTDILGTAVSAPLPLNEAQRTEDLPFSMEVMVNGSMRLRMVPVGRVTRARMASAWPDPSFQGAFLPDSSEISAKGFTASWTVLHLNRPYPQQFLGDWAWQLAESGFGVDLMLPVDEYQKSTRAAKYGFMLIALVFLVFFFVEVLQRLRIHPIQYLLVGLALCIFYTLLIALGEHIGFGRAYVVSAAAVIGLVVFYAASVFRMPRATRLLAMVLVLVYGFVFTIIHQEGYALLMGSIGLFIVLAVVMVLSRHIDWYNVRNDRA
jgi:inner membrane protein